MVGIFLFFIKYFLKKANSFVLYPGQHSLFYDWHKNALQFGLGSAVITVILEQPQALPRSAKYKVLSLFFWAFINNLAFFIRGKCQDLLCANYKEFGWFEFTQRSKHSLKTFSVRELDSCKTCYMHYARVSWNVSSNGTNIKVWKNQRFLDMSWLILIIF